MTTPANPAAHSPNKLAGKWAWLHTTLRWAFILACVLAIGPLASTPLARLHDAEGGPAVTMLLSESRGGSIIATALVLATATIVAAIAAWCFSAGTAFACAGLVLGWGAWRMGDADAILRRTREGTDLPALSLENLLIITVTTAITLLIGLLTLRRQHNRAAAPDSWPAHLATDAKGKGSLPIAAICLGAGTLAATIVAFLAAATMAKGQAVFAACLAGIASGVVVHLVARGQNGLATPTLVTLCALAPAALGPVVAQALHATRLMDATFAGTLLPLARIVSLDWACGLLLGVPAGLGWAGAMLDERSADAS
jgi:hypothetical protein